MSWWLPAQQCQLLSCFSITCGLAHNECALSHSSDNKRVKNTSSLLVLGDSCQLGSVQFVTSLLRLPVELGFFLPVFCSFFLILTVWFSRYCRRLSEALPSMTNVIYSLSAQKVLRLVDVISRRICPMSCLGSGCADWPVVPQGFLLLVISSSQTFLQWLWPYRAWYRTCSDIHNHHDTLGFCLIPRIVTWLGSPLSCWFMPLPTSSSATVDRDLEVQRADLDRKIRGKITEPLQCLCYSVSCWAVLKLSLVFLFSTKWKKPERSMYFLEPCISSVWWDLCPGVQAASDDSLRTSLDSFSAIAHIQVPVKHQTLHEIWRLISSWRLWTLR